MDFVTVVDQAIALLRQRGRLTYRTLQFQFQLDDTHLEALKDERIEGQRLAVDAAGRVLVGTGAPGATAPASTPAPAPLTYTPSYLAEKILTSHSALEGKRKQIAVLFADLKGSTSFPGTSEKFRTLWQRWHQGRAHYYHDKRRTVPSLQL